MSRLHICNTFFERELSSLTQKSLEKWMTCHPTIIQLQFLPLLYAKASDKILVTHIPDIKDSRLCVESKDLEIIDWGSSVAIEEFAKKHNHIYQTHPKPLLEKINSKIFSYTISPKLKNSCIVHNSEELEAFLQSFEGPKILKTPMGTAGYGHIHVQNVKPLYKLTFPLIAEPWVERVLDFSTQWKNAKLQGITVFENEPNGTYRGTFESDVPNWAIDQHLKVVLPIIETIKNMGYEGHIGIDAFIYKKDHEQILHPVVEINARKTMSWVALQTKTKSLFYTKTNRGLLPSSIVINGKKIEFSRNINFTR